jgi:hypothetical protein
MDKILITLCTYLIVIKNVRWTKVEEKYYFGAKLEPPYASTGAGGMGDDGRGSGEDGPKWIGKPETSPRKKPVREYEGLKVKGTVYDPDEVRDFYKEREKPETR